MQYFKAEKQYGATIRTSSNIPVARGLKSSSAAANATVIATAAALGKTLDDLTAVKLGVEAAYDAKVTITGAFDDACASYFGGVIVTDNFKRKLLKQDTLPLDITVLFFVPPTKAYTANSNVNRMTTMAPLVKVAYSEALKGNYWTALSLNGLIYSSALNYDASVAVDALTVGALAAGLCGKGPAVTIVASDDKVDAVKATLQRQNGEIIQTRINHEKAKVVT